MPHSRRSFFAAALAPAFTALAQQGPIKVTAIRAWPVSLNFGMAFANKTFTSDFDPARWQHRGPLSQLGGAILVELETNQGITGYGMGGGGGAAVYVIEHHLSDFVRNADPRHVETLADQMFAGSSLYGRRGLAIMAISAVDLALWDAAGKAAGMPVHQMLGGPTFDKIPAYFTGEPETGLKLGFRNFKLPIVHGVMQGREGMTQVVEQVARARKLIGADCELMIDCGSRWDVHYTLEMDKRLAEHRLKFIEEPLDPDDILGYQRLCQEIRHSQIASGEHEYTRHGFGELFRHKAVHYAQPDVTWSGGLSECRRVCSMASSFGVPVIPHRGSTAFGLALIASTTNCQMAESFGIGEPGNDVMAAIASRYEKGHYYPNTKPGFGVELTRALIEKHVRKF
jgi:L-rhamnonate dehydratase